MSIHKHPKVFDSSEEGIRKAAEIINSGGVVILPTDTVYGIFGRVNHPEAVGRVFEIKKRPTRKPFVIFTNKDRIKNCANLNTSASNLIKNIWPEALSIILEKTSEIPDWFTDGHQTVALAPVSNKVVSKIITLVDDHIFGTTANFSGEPETDKAEVVFAQFIDAIDGLVADDSLIKYRTPTTMVDCTVNPPAIVRLAALSIEEIRKFEPNIGLNYERRLT